MIFVLKMSKFSFKMRYFVLQVLDFVFKFGRRRRNEGAGGWDRSRGCVLICK